MFIIAGCVFFIAWANFTLWQIFADRISYKIRLVYFRKCLEMDAKFYDQNNPNEMAAKIAKEITAINRGTGEKIG